MLLVLFAYNYNQNVGYGVHGCYCVMAFLAVNRVNVSFLNIPIYFSCHFIYAGKVILQSEAVSQQSAFYKIVRITMNFAFDLAEHFLHRISSFYESQ